MLFYIVIERRRGAKFAQSVMLSDSMRTYCKWPFWLIGNVPVGADLGKEPLALLVKGLGCAAAGCATGIPLGL